MSGKYDDIVNLPHHTSATRPRMPVGDRAAQFAPFAALTGYDDAVQETARLTDKKLDLTEDAMGELNEKLQLLQESLDDHPFIVITYFVPDKKKAGGAYIDLGGTVKKIDDFERMVVMTDGTKIPIGDILEIELNPA